MELLVAIAVTSIVVGVLVIAAGMLSEIDGLVIAGGILTVVPLSVLLVFGLVQLWVDVIASIGTS